ncbi:MAG: hypothetical protein FWF42_03625 [Streptococcaceae bacterium]|nr:hypothetical protein [Streptococcaceae bacterium]
MQRTSKIIQVIIRVVMLIVAIGMIVVAGTMTGLHMANKNIEKTTLTGKIVTGDEGLREVQYNFQDKKLQNRPLDTYFRSLGSVGDSITVYVENSHPERIFISNHGDSLLETAGFMVGWGLLLGVILIGERQLMTRIKVLEAKVEESESE